MKREILRIGLFGILILFSLTYLSALPLPNLEVPSISGGGTTNVTNNYYNVTGGNTTEEMQDAVGSGFTGNLSYNDTGNSFDLNGANVLSWLDGIYARISNIVSLVGNWSADKPSYSTTAQILGFNYYNSTTIPNFVLNNSAGWWVNFTKIYSLDWSNVSGNQINNNLNWINWSVASNGTLMFTSNWNSTNTSYALNSVLQNGSYLNQDWLLQSQWNATNISYFDLNKSNIAEAFNQTFDTNTFFIDSTNNRVGIGTISPTGQIHLKYNGDTSNIIRLEAPNVAHGITTIAPTTVYSDFILANTGGGGLQVRGFTDDPTIPIQIAGYYGGTPGTGSSVRLIGAKRTGTSLQSLANTEKVVDILNFNTILLTILGSGNVGIGTTSPNQNLHVVGNLNVTGNIYVGGCIQYNYNTTLGVCI